MEIIQLANTYSLLEAYIKLPKCTLFMRDAFFPNRFFTKTEYAIVDFRKAKRVMAAAVDQEVGHSALERQNFDTYQFWTPFFAPTRALKAIDLLPRMPGESPFTEMTTVDRAGALISLDMIELDEILTRREEWMAVQAIVFNTFTLPIAGKNGTFNYVVDFTMGGARPGSNVVKLAAAAQWSASTSNPLQDLDTYTVQTLQFGLIAPNVVIFDQFAYEAFLSNLAVDRVFFSFRGDSGSQVGVIKPEVMSDSVTFVGRLRRPDVSLYVYTEFYVQDGTITQTTAGTEVTMLPQGTVIIGSTRSRNAVYYGPITQLERVGGGDVAEFTWSNQPRVPKIWADIDHDQRWTRLAMRSLPVPLDLSEWTVLSVLGAW